MGKSQNTTHLGSLRNIKQWIKNFDPSRVNYIPYAVINATHLTNIRPTGEGIISAFALQFILCLKVLVKINLPCLVHTTFSQVVENLKWFLLKLLANSTLYC